MSRRVDSEEGELMATERIFTDQLGDWKRSCYCGEPRADAVGKELTLFGWVRSAARPRRGYFRRSARPKRHLPDCFQSGSATRQPMKRPSNCAPKT